MYRILLLCALLAPISAKFTVPEAKITVYKTGGFDVSIPDRPGIKLFAFHGRLNDELNGREGGEFSRDVTRAVNGRWTFVDTKEKLKVGDVLHYWTYVNYFDGEKTLGYANDDRQFVVQKLVNRRRD